MPGLERRECGRERVECGSAARGPVKKGTHSDTVGLKASESAKPI